MNAIENIVKMVTELKKELEEMPETKEAKPVSREEFTLLLSGISTCLLYTSLWRRACLWVSPLLISIPFSGSAAGSSYSSSACFVRCRRHLSELMHGYF